MPSRRDFLKQAALLAAGGMMPLSIQRAFAIDPPAGSTYLDAEHIVILMQENRSFDHCYGSLRGVRGFNDPRAITLPDGNPVWFQTNAAQETYAPFRLDIKDTNATWMGSLPHSWIDQTEAANDGRHDRWLMAKASGHKRYAQMPLTMGYYDRRDLPFYYALADAFTICDQNFCSSLTGTTPNRLHLWSGTIRPKPSMDVKAHVYNGDTDYDEEVSWKAFPERLEELGVSWRVYQNEISLPTGFSNQEDAWLANFTDNPLEWFTQFRVRFSATHRAHLAEREKTLTRELAEADAKPAPTDPAALKKLQDRRAELKRVQADGVQYTEANFNKLPAHDKNLHLKAFTTNSGDSDYRKLDSLTYNDGTTPRRMSVPKGDVFHQFRQDVREGKLPTVSWLVAPEQFSDHPGAPWYGAWYISQTLDILTQNPDVWKKTIFVLCYDENDGYFDHIPPFVPPTPNQPSTGKVSAGIDPGAEQVKWQQDQELQRKYPQGAGRTWPIGLGFRVPLVIASPWSRGGYVCSEVFDHTSILRLLENILTHRTKRTVREENISAWRRTVCGDLSSSFRPYNGESIPLPVPVTRNEFLESIYNAQFKPLPGGYKKLAPADVAAAREQRLVPRQEPGVRPACALPYELAVQGMLSRDRKSFAIEFAAGKERFGNRSAGAPFQVSVPGAVQQRRSYAVTAGDRLTDNWLLTDFPDGTYKLRVDGPNGFFREFRGNSEDPHLTVTLRSPKGNPDALELVLENHDAQRSVQVVVRGSGSGTRTQELAAHGAAAAVTVVPLDLSRDFGWYDENYGSGRSRLFAAIRGAF